MPDVQYIIKTQHFNLYYKYSTDRCNCSFDELESKTNLISSCTRVDYRHYATARFIQCINGTVVFVCSKYHMWPCERNNNHRHFTEDQRNSKNFI